MSLKTKAISGFFWTSAGTLGNGLVSFLVTIILARLLEPRDFALIALLTIFVAVSNIIIDSGFSQAIIRDDKPSQKDLSSVFFFNITISLVLYIILFICAPFIANFFDAPELTSLSRVAFLVIIFNSFTIIQNATLNRELNFAAVSKASVMGAFLAGIISVVMAFTNCGIWALVANMVLLPFFRSIFLWKQSKWKPTFDFSFLSIKKYFNFSVFLMIQGLVDVVVTNIVSLFIGKVYTKDDLGYYSQGGKLNEYVVVPIVTVVRKVTYPILSKLKNNEETLRNGYMQVIKIMLLVFIPMQCFTIITADNFVVFFFGEKWIEAAPYLIIFAIASLFYPIQELCINILLVKGRTKKNLIISLTRQLLRILAVVFFVNTNVLIFAGVFTFAGVIGSVIFILAGLREIKYSIIKLTKDSMPICIATLCSCIVIFLFNKFLIGVIPLQLIFILQAIIMFLIYTFLCVILKVDALTLFIDEIKNFKHSWTNKNV